MEIKTTITWRRGDGQFGYILMISAGIIKIRKKIKLQEKPHNPGK